MHLAKYPVSHFMVVSYRLRIRLLVAASLVMLAGCGQRTLASAPTQAIVATPTPTQPGTVAPPPMEPVTAVPTATPDLTARQLITTTYIDYAADVLGVVVDGNMKVLHVEVDSAAAKAGLQEGDVLDTLDDLAFIKDRQKVKDKIHEPNFSEPKKVKKFKLKFKRADKMQEVDVSPGPPTAQPVQGTVTPVWDPEDYF